MARKIYALVKVEPITTPALRNAVAQKDKALRAAFAKAMIELQVTLNIVRSNAPEAESDIWLRFSELYPAIAARSVRWLYARHSETPLAPWRSIGGWMPPSSGCGGLRRQLLRQQ